MSIYQSQEEIELLVQGFIGKTLPKEQWTHHAHLTTAIWHLKNYDVDEATCLLKSGIISYNLSVGSINNGSGGYHETLTIFWITVVDCFVRHHSHLNLTDTCNAFLQSNLADRALPFLFYIKENVLSKAARAKYMQADKMELTDENMGKLLMQVVA